MKFEVLRTLARCRVIEKLTMNFPDEVISELMQEMLIVKEEVIEGETLKVIFTLTDKGELFIKQNMPEIRELYRGFVLKQDLTLCDFYLRRSEAEKKSWITRDDLIKKYKLPGTVDGAFVNEEGVLEAVKTLSHTAEYSALQKVEDFIRAVGIEHVSYIMFTK